MSVRQKIAHLERRLAQWHGSREAKEQVEGWIDAMVKKHDGMTRHQSAQIILDSKERWFVQTPEGEYLQYVIRTE